MQRVAISHFRTRGKAPTQDDLHAYDDVMHSCGQCNGEAETKFPPVACQKRLVRSVQIGKSIELASAFGPPRPLAPYSLARLGPLAEGVVGCFVTSTSWYLGARVG